MLLSPTCSAIAGRKVLCDGKATANINALRIQKAYEGKGHISKLIRALRNHITKLTIDRRRGKGNKNACHLLTLRIYKVFICRDGGG